MTLRRASNSLVEESRAGLREKRHDVTTNKGVVAFLNEAINAFVVDPDGTIIGRNELNTLGYVLGIQLRAIQAVQDEENPDESLSDLLGSGAQIEIRMTREERKMFLTSGSQENMIKVLKAVKDDGRLIELSQQADGSFSIPATLAEPPRMDALMPVKEIAQALNSQGTVVTQQHVRAILGPSLGSEAGAAEAHEEIEEFGYDALFTADPRDIPGTGHEWHTVSKEHPVLPGAVIRVSECTRCGVTTRNTKQHETEVCDARTK